MSEGPSAPHSTAAKAINKMSNNSWLAFSARGSSNFLKTFLNLPIRLPFRCGSRPQNPGFAPMQEKPQSHMRFPCPTRGEGAGPYYVDACASNSPEQPLVLPHQLEPHRALELAARGAAALRIVLALTRLAQMARGQ